MVSSEAVLLHVSEIIADADVYMTIHSELFAFLGKIELITEHFFMSGKTQKQSNRQQEDTDQDSIC